MQWCLNYIHSVKYVEDITRINTSMMAGVECSKCFFGRMDIPEVRCKVLRTERQTDQLVYCTIAAHAH